jgi:hypothetical protein
MVTTKTDLEQLAVRNELLAPQRRRRVTLVVVAVVVAVVGAGRLGRAALEALGLGREHAGAAAVARPVAATAAARARAVGERFSHAVRAAVASADRLDGARAEAARREAGVGEELAQRMRRLLVVVKGANPSAPRPR